MVLVLTDTSSVMLLKIMKMVGYQIFNSTKYEEIDQSGISLSISHFLYFRHFKVNRICIVLLYILYLGGKMFVHGRSVCLPGIPWEGRGIEVDGISV